MSRLIYKAIFSLHPVASYAIFAAIGLLPMMIALAMGADKTVTTDFPGHNATAFRGYISWSNLNWLGLPLFLPLATHFVRQIARLFFGIGENDSSAHVISSTYFRGRCRTDVFRSFQKMGSDSRILVAALLLAGLFEIFDLREQLLYYYRHALLPTIADMPREASWGYLFVLKQQTDIGWAPNLALVVAAHLSQYCLMALLFLGLLLAIHHNLHYLGLIYQRYRITTGDKVNCKIRLDFDDGNRCFGLRPLNGIFNLQVRLVAMVGAFLLFSRYTNVSPELSLQLYRELAQISIKSSPLEYIQAIVYEFLPLSSRLFSDFGQLFIATAWVLALFIVSLPALVKFLPLFSHQVRASGWDRREFLLQFIPPYDTRYGMADAQKVDELASKFCESSFWPSGDQRARLYYRVAFMVFFIILLPIRPVFSEWKPLFVYVVLISVMSIGATSILFLLLKNILRYVDQSLVK